MAQPRSKRAAPASGGITVRLDFGGGDVEEVVVDRSTFTFGELHEVRKGLARLSVVDESGRTVLEPTVEERVLVHAWVVMRRTRPVSWSEVFDRLPSGGLSTVQAGEDDDSPEV